jgi:uncharacterized protein YbjQ (UPF0145 family)
MMTSTCETITNMTITESLGLVKGNTIRARHIGRDILAGLKTIVGGEISDYTKAIAEAREQALDRMIEDARRLGADAIVCVRFSTCEVMKGAAEIMAYGTAVKIRNNDE